MKRWLNSVQNAIRGVYLLFHSERNARIELVFAFFAIGVSLWLNISGLEWCLILLCIGMVLAAEAINTAVERLADLHTKDHNRDIGQLKDIAAGGVLILAFIALCMGMIILLPKLIERLEL